MDEFDCESKTNKLNCIECNTKITIKLINKKEEKIKNKKQMENKEEFKNSSKIDELIKQLNSNDINEKCIVFSQFTSFLDLVEIALDKENIKYCRLDGSMSHTVRSSNLHKFKVILFKINISK